MQLESETPQGDLTTRTLAMPADANPAGDIFGVLGPFTNGYRLGHLCRTTRAEGA